MNTTATQLLQCHGCSALIQPGDPVFEVDERGLITTYTRVYCAEDCRREQQEREEWNRNNAPERFDGIEG